MALTTSPLAGSGHPDRSQSSSMQKPPNVILIMTDDQGYGDLSCHGNSVLKTPHLDSLHAQSVRFTDFHVDPTCSPTRASLLTGRYSSRTGVWHTIMGRSQLRADETTMADIFLKNGYRTGIFGKWHLGDNYPYRPHDRGFDESLVIGGGAIGNAPDYWDNDYFDDTYKRNGEWEKAAGYCTDVFFDEAMKFILSSGDRPFFLYLPTNTPHWPHIVAEKYSDPYKEQVPERMATFYGMIANIDENIGRLLRFLKDSGLEENTILVFLTDNGTSFGLETADDGRATAGFNVGMRGTKGSIYEGGHRVPCFIRWPKGGIGGGRDISFLSAHIDILPTLLDLCGLKSQGGAKIDGSSLAAHMQNPDFEPLKRILFVHSQRVDFPIKWRQCAVMTDRWRLINGRELYDMKDDPGQKTDIADGHPDVVAQLRGSYEKWWENISARFDEYTDIPIGTEFENPVVLTSHDIHGQVAWDHVHVRRNTPHSGFWAVDFKREGRYRIRVMRWPEESGIPILDTPEGATEMQATHARLKVADFDETLPIGDKDRAVEFEVTVKKGRTRLQAWLIDCRSNGRVNSAFYVYVKKI
ncbi:MAG TPA: arylsulfatase [Candidatus Desulfaltia sp.]|nr:arylsulfatase [Candidatus Desulfaltia sp.]